MALKDLLSNALLWRRLIKAQEAQATALTTLAVDVKRIADHVAPIEQEASVEDLKQTGVRFGRDADQARILDFIERFQSDTGREPTADEIVAMLDGTASI